MVNALVAQYTGLEGAMLDVATTALMLAGGGLLGWIGWRVAVKLLNRAIGK